MFKRMLFFFVLPAFLFAQNPVPQDSIMTVELDEVVVTATRIGGEILQLPMAVGIVSSKDFLTSRRFGLDEALWAMPGVFAQSRAGGQDVRLTIRGFGARGNGDRSNSATIRGVKVLVNGIPETEPDGRTALDLIDLTATSHIEVVRSNASTLFGNASGGVVNIETMPWFTTPYLETSNVLGSYGLRRNSLSYGTPVGGGRLFVTATNSTFDGAREHSSSNTTQVSIAMVTALSQSTGLKLNLRGAANRFSIPGPLTAEEFESAPSHANSVYAARRERRFNRVGRLGIQVNNDFAKEHSLEFLGYLAPKMLERSERNTFRNFYRLHFGGGAVYNWRPVESMFARVTAGVDGASQDGSVLFYSLVNGERGDSLRSNQQEAATTLGAFAHAEFKLFESLSLTVGVRLDRQIYVSQELAAGANGLGMRDELVLDHVTPKIALLYRVHPNHSLYVNVGGGLEAPAFNEVDPPPTLSGVSLNPLLKPMISTTIELGVKGVEQFSRLSFLRSLSYSAAVYAITINDEIVPYGGGAWYFSAGRSRRYGVESGIHTEFIGGLSLRAAVTYLQAEYREYSNELGDFSGNTVPGIAPLVLNARLRYALLGGCSIEAGLEHVSSYFADDANIISAPSYFLLHSSVSYAFRLGGFKVQTLFGVNNMTDEHYASSAFINPVNVNSGGNPISPAFLEPGMPVNIFLGLDVQVEL